MDELPFDFYDGVFGQLPKKDLQTSLDLSGVLGAVAAEHCEKRRELSLWVRLSADLNLCSFVLGDNDVSLSDLRPKYDRIVAFTLLDHSVWNMYEANLSFEDTLKKVAFALRFVANCSFWSGAYSELFCKPFFRLLRRFRVFKKVTTSDLGKQCRKFVKKQAASGFLEELWLNEGSWPNEFNALLRSYIKTPKFYQLHCKSRSITFDFETVSTLLERWATGQLRRLSLDIYVSFGKERLVKFLHKLGCTSKKQTFKLAGRSSLKMTFKDNYINLDVDFV
ncbi:hypothetical protein QR680_004211 [Steinernema hermaphroditum]|uniref:Uncharacterized protein n=1 Tax=Steinernema hermaphroditum TaxID=289476 RepID=A0AA39HPD7_9BILA|nr:hypothetical protein QR680_004211 [Steinernema hermaphroditum]